ncbi:uncharacterized protein LOC129753732 [Uranotaenia lowii]|uniref:uncharacterized protein LOC129753732 n=1 Tax=Uranotaenia lowii TaxID=190385 RepID=UPI00247A15E4|nr:uncharacterized protein LOC129753732 [Uranotaenia lowii]
MSPSPGDHPNRTIPEWMDPQSLHGRLYYLTLQGAKGKQLPKNPFLIGRSIENFAGNIEGAFFEKSRNWYVLKIRNKNQGRLLTTLTTLLDGTPIMIGRHPSLNQRKLVVTCREVDGMDDKVLLEELSPQKVIDVRRITKKTTTGIIGTSTLILTINSTIIPEFINFGLLRVRTRIYYSQPLLCRQCLQYGHPKSRCKNLLACKNCSRTHESANCKAEPFCGNCKTTGHSPLDRKCPIWTAESTALKLSTDKNITIYEARRMVHTSSNTTSYADAVKTNQTQKSTTHQQQVNKNEEPIQQTSQNQKRTLEKPHTPTAPQQSFQTDITSLDSDSPPRKRTPLPTSVPATSSLEVVREDMVTNSSRSVVTRSMQQARRPPETPK